MRHAPSLLAIAILAGCAQPPPMDRAQYLAATTRTYPGKTKEQVIAAAEAVLTVADPGSTFASGFKYAHNDDGFVASHRIEALAATGAEYWDLRVRETPQGARVSMQLNSSRGAVGLLPTTTAGTYAATTLPGNAQPVAGDAIYDLFFARLDYMLWARQDWATCAESDARLKAGKVAGPNDALCRAVFLDDVPGQPRKSRSSPQEEARRNPDGLNAVAQPMTPDRKR